MWQDHSPAMAVGVVRSEASTAEGTYRHYDANDVLDCGIDRDCDPFAGMHWKRWRYPPLQGAQPVPSHCLPDGECQAQWHL